MKIEIKHIYCGQSQTINDGKHEKYKSSYKKKALNKSAYELDEYGFKDDTQSDLESHGGVDKAVCVYSLKNYKYLEDKYDINLPSCAFGENLSILSSDDSQICLGDRFSCGEVIFEVSQPRQPCWKISSIIGIKKLTAMIVKEYKTGFYLRVLQSGSIKPNDKLELISRVHPKFTIEFINKIAYNAKKNQEALKELLDCSELARDYHASLAKRYKDKDVGLQAWQRDEYVEGSS
jgi:MOSC domain-containing protein YiiM